MRWMVVPAVLAVLVLAVVGCGGSDSEAVQESNAVVATESAPDDSTATDDSEASDDGSTDTDGSGILTGECKGLGDALVGYQAALGAAAGAPTDLGDSAAALSKLADAAPDEIRESFKTLAGAVAAYAKALEGVDLNSEVAPDPETLAKIVAATSSFNSEDVAAASQAVADWTKENCTP